MSARASDLSADDPNLETHAWNHNPGWHHASNMTESEDSTEAEVSADWPGLSEEFISKLDISFRYHNIQLIVN